MRYLARRARLIPLEPAPLSVLLGGRCYAVDEVVGAGSRDAAKGIAYSALLLTLSGASAYRVNGREVVVRPGSLLLIPSGISFSERVVEDCRNIYLMFEGILAGELASVVPPGLPFVYWSKCPRPWATSLTRCVELAHRTPDIPVWDLGAEICRLAGLLKSGHGGTGGGDSLAGRLRSLVYGTMERAMPVAEMARAMGMSPSAFAHRFKNLEGIAPAAFVRSVRCEIARSMLESGMRVAEVAERAGFANPYHFSRVFKSVTGSPPSACLPEARRLHRRAGG